MALPPFLEDVAKNEQRIVKIQLLPDRWPIFCDQYDLDWHYTPFERKKVAAISNAPGVYCFHVGHRLHCLPPLGLSLYGGISKVSLRERCLNYFWEKHAEQGRFWVRKFLHVFEDELTLGWSEVDATTVDLNVLEKDFNDAMMPPYSVKDFSADIRAGRNAWQ